MITLSIGKTFRQLRRRRNLTARDLARKSGVDIYVIHNIENDTKLPRNPTLIKLCDFLDVDLLDVYSGNIKFRRLLPEPKSMRHDSVAEHQEEFLNKLIALLKNYKLPFTI